MNFFKKIKKFFNSLNKTELIVSLTLVAIIIVGLVVLTVVEPVLIFLLLGGIIFIVYKSNECNKQNIILAERQQNDIELDELLFYEYISDNLHKALKPISSDFGIICNTKENLYVNPQKRVCRKTDGTFYMFSCISKTQNSKSTLYDLRNYLNKELKEIQLPCDPLVQVLKIKQTDNRLYFIAVVLITRGDHLIFTDLLEKENTL